MSKLRDYQERVKLEVYGAWAGGARNVCAVMPTGAGKTVLVANMVSEYPAPVVVIAHRQELVTQMSTALARYGVRHRIIGADAVMRAANAIHMSEFRRTYVDRTARVAVAGVDTLMRMDDPSFAHVGLWVLDECHHLVRDNKWHKAVSKFPNARGLGVTATPLRADGKGLGRHADGVMDTLVVGPGMRELIGRGYLTEYRIFCPPSDVDYSQVETSAATGDYKPDQLRAAVHKSTRIVGDIVGHYLKIARGKQGATFVVDLEEAAKVAQAYREAGVPAEVISGKTPDALRASIMRRFRAGEIKQIVSVDILGEGVDVPAIEVVSFARKTESYGLYVQQFGRALRLLDGKEFAIIIDHVGNVLRHGLPDAPREWSLDRREKRSSGKNDAIPLRICTECTQPFERALCGCPWCGAPLPEPAARSLPEYVDGDLYELDPAALAAMRGEIERIDGPAFVPGHLEGIAAAGVRKQHRLRQEAQADLRQAMALWGGWQAAQGRDSREAMKRFYFAYGVDSGTAQTLGAREASELAERVRADLDKHGVIAA